MVMTKSDMGPGPWQDEVDKERWIESGLSCLIKRGPVGAWCGYVALPPGHPMYGMHYDVVDVDVHGGLTYSDYCNEVAGICHPGGIKAWWVGFDCAHAGDFVPAIAARHTRLYVDEVYRDIEYAIAETTRLAQQLAAM